MGRPTQPANYHPEFVDHFQAWHYLMPAGRQTKACLISRSKQKS
jgi:hypothetical protein